MNTTANSRPIFRKLALFTAIAACLGVATADVVIKTDAFDYRIHYHPEDTSATDFVSDADAQSIADMYDPASGTGLHQTYMNLGFREPKWTDILGIPVKRKILLENSPITQNRSNTLFPDRIVLVPSSSEFRNTLLDADLYNFDRSPTVPVLSEFRRSSGGFGSALAKDLCAHELSHIVQFQYVPWGLHFLDLYPMGIEGTATAMEDSLGSDIDTCPRTDFSILANAYLETNSVITDSSEYFWSGDGYHSGLFWKYLMEQFGTARTEPGVGVDVMERFYELADLQKDDGIATLMQDVMNEKNRYTTTANDPGAELSEVFQDFTIANRLDGLGLPLSGVADAGRFQYVDDIVRDSGKVPLTFNFGPLSEGNNTGAHSATVERYAATYLKCDFSAPTSNVYGVGFFAQSHDSSKVWFSLAGERKSGVIDIVSKGTVHPEEDNTFQYAVMQNTTDPYVKFHVITNGDDCPPPGPGFTSTKVGFDFNFAYFQPTLSIREPNTDYRAHVGDGAAPDRFIAKVRVTSPDYLGSGSVNGLNKDQFTVYVGTSIPSNQATVLSAAYVLGEYWLTCQAPVKHPTPGTAQSLTVKLGGASDTEETAIMYNFLMVDQMLVIDRSGSMATTSSGVQRIDGARAAAQLFIDASGSDDQIGVVTFNGDSSTEPDSYADGQVIYNLQTMNSQFERDLVNLLIDETNPAGDKLAPTGSTSIGDGIYQGAAEIVANGQPDAEKWILLLSDGHQNEDSKWDDQAAFISGTGIHVESIALGSGCDNNLLQSIADESKGYFYQVDAPDDPPPATTSAHMRTTTSSSSSSSAAARMPMLLDLANNYLQSSEHIHRRERIVENYSSLASGASTSQTINLTEGGLTDCVVTVFSDQSSGIGLTVTRPDGSTVAAPDVGDTSWNPDRYVNYRISTMSDGTWTFNISNSATRSANYIFVVSGRNRQGAQAQVCFAQFHGNNAIYAQNGLYLRGLPMPILAVVTDGNGPVKGATVLATVTHPTRPPVTLLLRDDGAGYDGTANDGVYGGLFRATTESSFSGQSPAEGAPLVVTPSYKVAVNVTGKDNLGRNFERVKHGAFQVYETEQGDDTDGDGMPARYEALHAGLNAAINDAAGDNDSDGLTNIQEYQIGTDPGLADTDGGGETDASELAHGANPWDHRDDAVPKPLVARVLDRWGDVRPPSAEFAYLLPQPAQNIVMFSVERGYKDVDIYRSSVVSGPYTKVATVDTAVRGGVYLDTGLTNGITYYYYIQPCDASGRVGVTSAIFTGTPRANVDPPDGEMIINEGKPYTTSTTVALRFDVTLGVTQVKLATSLTALSTAAWGAFTTTVPTFSLGAITSGSTCHVYAILRDAVGNETPVESAITYLAPAGAATFTGTVVTSQDPDNRKASISLRSGNTVLVLTTNPSGTFISPIAPGTYDITISQRGYQTYVQNGAVFMAGATFNLGTINLTALDSDGDGLKDVAELRDIGSNRYDGDTDRDGEGDGLEVMVLMTSPTDPNSMLRVEGKPVVDRAAGTITITFQSVAAVTYGFEYSTSLAAGSWSNVLDGGTRKTVTATSALTTVTLSFPPGAPARFFRVVAR